MGDKWTGHTKARQVHGRPTVKLVECHAKELGIKTGVEEPEDWLHTQSN